MKCVESPRCAVIGYPGKRATIDCSIFFRSDAWCLERLWGSWQSLVTGFGKAVEVEGCPVLLGDHTYVVKDGGRMPGVVSLRETSETQSKPGYFRGQCWGAIGLLVGGYSACFCTPLHLQLHQGFRHLGETQAPLKLGEWIVQMALDYAHREGRPVWLVLDAYFAVGPVFRRACSVYSVALKQPLVQIITRAKKSYVAYYPPLVLPGKRLRGRPRLYGDKLRLWEVFEEDYLFRSATLSIYGEQENVQLLAGELLWRPLKQRLLFVWAITSRGPIVLMCSDLNAKPETVLELYCHRTRIEILFATLKQVIGAFRFHFWSQYLPRHARKPVSNQQLKSPKPQHADKVRACWQAMEMFVFCASVSTGLLQQFSLQYADSLWKQQVLYLRTRSRELPSENTVRQILAPLLARELMQSRPESIWAKICNAVSDQPPDKGVVKP